jgi:hypothetical protein
MIPARFMKKQIGNIVITQFRRTITTQRVLAIVNRKIGSDHLQVASNQQFAFPAQANFAPGMKVSLLSSRLPGESRSVACRSGTRRAAGRMSFGRARLLEHFARSA